MRLKMALNPWLVGALGRRRHGSARMGARDLPQIFSGNAELCLKLKEEDIARMVTLLAEYHRYEVLQLLVIVVRIDHLLLPVRRNQTLVIKYLMQNRDKARVMTPDCMCVCVCRAAW